MRGVSSSSPSLPPFFSFSVSFSASFSSDLRCYTYNLGTGKGYSVLEMVKAMEVSAGKEIPYKIGPRREGDIASVYAIPDKAREELGWEAKKGLEDMCNDAWRWQSQNPTGFPKPDEGKA